MIFSRKIQLGLVPIFLLAMLLATPSFAQAADHLVISQIQITGGPGKTNEDFIEIYNPTNAPIDLKGHRLVKRTKDGSTDSLIKSFTDSLFIPASGYFLWANSTYTDISVTPDVVTSSTLASDNAVALRFGANDMGVLIDAVGWGLATNALVEGSAYPTNPEAGQSLLRKSSTDTNNNAVDFEVAVPTPRNTGGIGNPDQSEESDQSDTPAPSGSTQQTPNINHLIINEIAANPSGSDSGLEWVEFYNQGDLAFDLSGWLIDDTGAEISSNAFKIPAGTTVPAKGYKVVTLAAGSPALNNTGGDCVRLFTKEKSLAKNVCYTDTVKEGSTYAITTSGLYSYSTEPTPGSPNRFPAPTPSTSGGSNSSNSSNSSSMSSKIVISELLPHPEGEEEEEFIEFYNSGSEEVDLAGWQVRDKARSYTISADDFSDTTLSPSGYFVVPRTISKIALNNTGGETVELVVEDKVISAATYEGSAKAGSVYALTDKVKFVWSATPTPGEKNIIAEFEVDEEEFDEEVFEDEIEEEKATTTLEILSIAEARRLPDESIVRVAGRLAALPGVLGSNVAYIADDNGQGLRVLLARGKGYPDLALGHEVEIVGELDTVRNELVLKVSDEVDIQPGSAGDTVATQDVRTGSVNESIEGGVVRVSGTITSTSGSTFYINDGSGDVRIYIVEGTNISKPKMKRGDKFSITGIVSQYDDVYRVMPRMQEDIQAGQVAGISTLSTTGQNLSEFMVLVGTISLGIFLYLTWLRRKSSGVIIDK